MFLYPPPSSYLLLTFLPCLISVMFFPSFTCRPSNLIFSFSLCLCHLFLIPICCTMPFSFYNPMNHWRVQVLLSSLLLSFFPSPLCGWVQKATQKNPNHLLYNLYCLCTMLNSTCTERCKGNGSAFTAVIQSIKHESCLKGTKEVQRLVAACAHTHIHCQTELG